MPREIKTLLIGLGNIGYQYDELLTNKYIMSHFKALTSDKDFKLVGIIDIDIKRNQLFKKKYLYPIETSFKNLLRQNIEKPDLIVISSPTDNHKKALFEALNFFNPSIVLCEKPLSDNISDATEMVKICELKKINLVVNYFRRSEPGIRKINKLIKSHDLKNPQDGLVTYSGGFFRNGSHFFDLMSHMFGELNNYQTISCNKIRNINDFSWNGFLNFKNCKVYFKPMINQIVTNHSFEIIFENAIVKSRFAGRELIISWVEKDKLFKSDYIYSKDSIIENNFNRFQFYVYQDIKNYIRNLNNNLCSGKLALKNQKIMEEIVNGDK